MRIDEPNLKDFKKIYRIAIKYLIGYLVLVTILFLILIISFLV